MSYIDRRHQAQWQPCWHNKSTTSRDYNHSRRRRWALEVQAAGEAEMCRNLIPDENIREQYRNKMHIQTFGRCSKEEEKELLLTTGLLMQVLSSRSVILWKRQKLSLQNMLKTKKTRSSFSTMACWFQKGERIWAKTKSWSCLCCFADESMNKIISLCPMESQFVLPLFPSNIYRWKSLKDKAENNPALIKKKLLSHLTAYLRCLRLSMSQVAGCHK